MKRILFYMGVSRKTFGESQSASRDTSQDLLAIGNINLNSDPITTQNESIVRLSCVARIGVRYTNNMQTNNFKRDNELTKHVRLFFFFTAFQVAPRFMRSSQISMAFNLEKVANSLEKNKILTKVKQRMESFCVHFLVFCLLT